MLNRLPRRLRRADRKAKAQDSEPPFGLYTCSWLKCNYLFVHDVNGWFYVYDHDSHVQPERWGIGLRFEWSQRYDTQPDCFNRPLTPLGP